MVYAIFSHFMPFTSGKAAIVGGGHFRFHHIANMDPGMMILIFWDVKPPNRPNFAMKFLLHGLAKHKHQSTIKT